jgi:hypothetical protein
MLHSRELKASTSISSAFPARERETSLPIEDPNHPSSRAQGDDSELASSVYTQELAQRRYDERRVSRLWFTYLSVSISEDTEKCGWLTIGITSPLEVAPPLALYWDTTTSLVETAIPSSVCWVQGAGRVVYGHWLWSRSGERDVEGQDERFFPPPRPRL